jgi:primosomal protein N' (replication factor Y)
MNQAAENFARIVIPSPLKEPLIYRVPPALRQQIADGTRVLIPLGKRKITGVVLELLHESAVPGTREIIALLDERPILDATLLQLGQWITQYYLATLGEVFGAILPPSLRSEIEERLSKTRNIYPLQRVRKTHSRQASSK